MAYLVREVCSLPGTPEPLRIDDDAYDDETKSVLAEISTRSSRIRDLPSLYDVWCQYYHEPMRMQQLESGQSSNAFSSRKGRAKSFFSRILSIAQADEDDPESSLLSHNNNASNMSKEERIRRCCQSYMAFILSSLRSRQKVNVGRSLVSLTGTASMIVTELGVIASIDGSAGSFVSNATSDRVKLCKELLSNCGTSSKDFYHISFARLASYGNKCIAVAWNVPGNTLGIIHIYKYEIPTTTSTSSKSQQIGWHLVGMIIRQGSGQKPCAVRDMIPVSFHSRETGHRYCLLVTRVGGVVDFVAIPRNFCDEQLDTSKVKRSIITISPIVFTSLIENRPLDMNHDSSCIEVYQEKSWTDRALVFLSGLSHTSSCCMVSTWMIFSHSKDRPVSIVNIGQIGVSSCCSFVSSTSLASFQQSSTITNIDENIMLPPIQISVSSDSRFVALLGYNGSINILECSDNNSTSCSIKEKILDDFFWEFSPEGYIQIMWTNARQLMAVSSSGIINLFDMINVSCIASINSHVSSFVSKLDGEILSASRLLQNYCIISMEKLNPQASVEQMILHKNVDEAHKMVVDYNIRDDTTLKALWEVTVTTKLLERNIEMASNITETLICRISDDHYVIQNSFTSDINVADVMLLIIDEGIKRVQRNGVNDQLVLLKNRRRRLVTYSWICSRKNVLFSGKRFASMFCDASLTDYAICCCHRQDFDLLTMLFLRHSEEILPERLTILSSIALTVDPELYEHLLPTIPSDFFRSHCPSVPCYFFQVKNKPDIMTVTDMISHFKNILPHDETYRDESKQGYEELHSTVEWYISRALAIEKSTGRMDLSHKFLLMASKRCKESDDKVGLLTWLASICSVTGLLSKCIFDMALPANYSLSDWSEIGLTGLINTLFSEHDGRDCLDLWIKYIMPLLNNTSFEYCIPMETFEDRNLRNVHTEAFTALLGYCKVRCAADEVRGLDVALAFARSSTTIFRSIDTKIDFIIDSIYSCDFCFSEDCIERMWSLYECLPTGNICNEELLEKISLVRKDLILATILINYEDIWGFDSFSILQGHIDAKVVLNRLLFCVFDQLLAQPKANNWHFTLMQLLVDVSEIRQDVFPKSKLIGYAENSISQFLIAEGNFDALRALINLNQSDILRRITSSHIADYTCFIYDNYNWNSINAKVASKCRELFTPIFPELSNLFEKQEKIAQIASFAEQFQYYPSLFSLRMSSPNKIIASFLAMNPDVFDFGWKDSESGRSKSHDLVKMLKENHDMSSFTLPGVPVRRLIMLLEARDSCIFGDAIMAKYAISLSLYPSAFALCYFLLYNVCYSHELIFDDFEIDLLDIVVKVASNGDFDSFLRFELCTLALSRIDLFRQNEYNQSNISSLIQLFSYVELKIKDTSGTSIKERLHAKNDDSTGFLIFQAASMFSTGALNLASPERSIKSSSLMKANTSTNASLSTAKFINDFDKLDMLRKYNLAVNEKDKLEPFDKDSNLLSLARETLVNCIDMSTKIRYASSEFVSIQTNEVQLAISLLLVVRNRNSVHSIVTEMISLLEEKTALSMEKLSQEIDDECHIAIPDENIVKQLCSYGFGENGARRSVAATKNESCSRALEYAMQHERDPNFNLPFILPKFGGTKEKRLLDQVAIHYVLSSLRFARKQLGASDLPSSSSTSYCNHESNKYSKAVEGPIHLHTEGFTKSWDKDGWDDDELDFDGDDGQVSSDISTMKCSQVTGITSNIETSRGKEVSPVTTLPIGENHSRKSSNRGQIIVDIPNQQSESTSLNRNSKIAGTKSYCIEENAWDQSGWDDDDLDFDMEDELVSDEAKKVKCGEAKNSTDNGQMKVYVAKKPLESTALNLDGNITSGNNETTLEDGWDDDFDFDSSSIVSEKDEPPTHSSHLNQRDLKLSVANDTQNVAMISSITNNMSGNDRKSKLLADARSILASRQSRIVDSLNEKTNINEVSRERLLSDARMLLQKRRDMILKNSNNNEHLGKARNHISESYSNREAALEAGKNLLHKRREAGSV